MLNDCKLAARRLRASPGFTAVATLTLALAIGANTAIFSFADAVLFRPLPYRDADEVFVVRMADPRTGARYTSVPLDDIRMLEERVDGVAGVGLLEPSVVLFIPTGEDIELVRAAHATANYFDVLGVRAARGRLFGAGDIDSPGRPTVLTWTTFQQRFGGDESVVGSAVTIDGMVLDIIGVLPRAFVFPTPRASGTELITVMPADDPAERGSFFYPVVRLRGTSAPHANAEIAALTAERAANDRPDERTVPVFDAVRAALYPSGRPMMGFLLAASALVLLIGCANLANMLSARTRLREREIAIQAALGASRLGLLRPLIIEALALGVVSSLAALLVAALAFDTLKRQVPPEALGAAPVGVGPRVVAFALLLGLGAGLLFAAVPALRAARRDARSLLGAGGRSTTRASFGRAMLAGQVALSIVLLFGGVVATRALVAVLNVPLGFEPESVVTARVAPVGRDPRAWQEFYVRAIEAMRDIPGVVAAGANGSPPFLGGAPNEGAIDIESGAATAGIYHVLPGYFEAAGIGLLRGRMLTSDDVRAGADVAVLSPLAGRALFGDRDPLGRAFASNAGRRLTVVGVVEEVVQSLDGAAPPQAYVIPADATRGLTLIVRARTRDEAVLEGVRRTLATLRPGMPITTSWWNDAVSAVPAFRTPRFQTMVLGSFAALGLGLTALGVFGLVAFMMATRMREMGIRLAVGATPAAVVRLNMRQSVLPTAWGVAAGSAATMWLARLAESRLWGIDTADASALPAAALLVLGTAAVAAYLPARHAARVDPMSVLRRE